jgi:hypothetical protein
VLQALGPSRNGPAHENAVQSGANQVKPVVGVARAANLKFSPHLGIETAKASPLPSDPIPGLVAKVQSQIANSPDALPPGENAAEVLRRISVALPQATRDERERVQELASDLFGRAKTAVDPGKVSSANI